MLDTNIIIDLENNQEKYNKIISNTAKNCFYVSHVQEDELDRIKKHSNNTTIREFLYQLIPTSLWILGYGKLGYIKLGGEDIKKFYDYCLSYMRANGKKKEYKKGNIKIINDNINTINKNKINSKTLYYNINDSFLIFKDDRHEACKIKIECSDNKIVLNSITRNKEYSYDDCDVSILKDKERLRIFINELPKADALALGLFDHINDAIIASTAYKENMILVTNDNSLYEAAKECQLAVLNINQLLELL